MFVYGKIELVIMVISHLSLSEIAFLTQNLQKSKMTNDK